MTVLSVTSATFSPNNNFAKKRVQFLKKNKARQMEPLLPGIYKVLQEPQASKQYILTKQNSNMVFLLLKKVDILKISPLNVLTRYE